jgi:hypothetical protein
MELDPRLKYLFDKGYTPETIKEKATQGVDPLNLYYFERGYSPKDVQIEQNKLNEGFGKKLLRGVLEPVATLVTRPFQVAKALTGAETPEEQGVSLPFLGRIEAPTTGQDIVKDVGRGLETVSLGIGGGGAKTAIQTGMKGLVKRGFVEGLGVGLKSGALMSFGQAIQEAENTPSDIAYKTIFGTTVGGLTGGLFGSLIPIAGKAINKTTGIVKKFSNIESLNDELVNLNKTALRPTNSQLRKWGEKNVDPMKTYTEIFGARLPQVDKNNRFIQESLQDLIGEVDNVYRPSAEAFNTILRNSPEVNSIRRMGDRAIREVENSNLTADARTKAIEKINTELNALKAEAKQAGKLFGDDNVPVELIDNWKDRYFTNTKYFGPEEAGITNTANRSLGFTFKEGIEEVIKDIGVKQYNKQLQQYIVLKDFLEELNGKLAGTGGRMTRLVSRGIGSVIGSNEGILGSTFGALTGDKLAQLWINPSLSPYRWLISMQLNKLPQAEKAVLVDEANAIIKQMFEKRMNTLNLPDPSFIPMGAATPPVSGTIKPQGPGGLFEYFENLKASQKAAGVYKIKEAPQSPKSQPAIMKPTIAVNKKPIDKTIPLEPKKSKTPVDKSLQGGYIQAYRETGDLTTKLLQKLEGRDTVSKQFISDLTNSADLKQVEKDIIRQVLQGEGNKVNVSEFAEKVKNELLPLKVKSSDAIRTGKNVPYPQNLMPVAEGNFTPIYENVSLPDSLRGRVANYKENIYESPVKTSAGGTHFRDNSNNYFGHTRIEDMVDNKTRRVIEVQSDLYQKGNLEQSVARAEMPRGGIMRKSDMEGLQKLQQYNDPTAHFRMVREELKKAAQDGKTKVQFPTGETAMKIEGLGERNNWEINTTDRSGAPFIAKAEIGDLKVGQQISQQRGDDWIITDVLGDGKFKAVPMREMESIAEMANTTIDKLPKSEFKDYARASQETFDISGKVDTNNPIYKFYEKDLGRYLKNNFNAQTVVDKQGVKWMEVPITKDMADKPVTAFGKIATSPLVIGAGATALGVGALKYAEKKSK